MIQSRTQTEDYWGSNFTLTEADIEQISNYFLEVERPQTAAQITPVVIACRIVDEANQVKKLLSGRTIYQPQNQYEVGNDLVFPALQFAYGTVTAVRDGYNPQNGQFCVIDVEINGKTREFAAELKIDHLLNADNGDALADLIDVNEDQILSLYGSEIEEKVTAKLEKQDGFVCLNKQWFIQALMAEVNVGHLHLAEAVLEMFEGGPLTAAEIIPHLDMDPGAVEEVQTFSLDYALLKDKRFDEVAPKGKVTWFLRRMEPDGVQKVPKRLTYSPIPYDRALLRPQLILLEQELDDEWSKIPPPSSVQPVVFTLMFPHRYAGVIPLSSRIKPLFPPSNSPRQRVLLVDDKNGAEIEAWVMQNERYIYGVGDWYNQHELPIGGFVHLQPGPKPGVLSLGYDRRKKKREWIRLATAVDNRIHFELERRSVGCGFDDLMIVGTDTITAIDVLWRRVESNQRSISSLLAELFPQLTKLNPQNTVHAKTLYSAINMLRRVPPGALFAELVRHPAFQPVGDHYWQFDRRRWRES
ncbi:MAG: hypothetical protein GY796_19150 [Chloroflexi bacterium]|nr:hypothetical protein [Chloroflexota bacterium]